MTVTNRPGNTYSARIEDVVAEHSTFLAAVECGAAPEEAIERAYGWKLDLVDSPMALSQIDQIVIRGLNDFSTNSESPAILDCGANIGISVLNYKRRFPGARIKAFEPDPAICRVLRENLVRNGAGDVEVVEAAAWTRNGEVTFRSHGTDGGRIDQNASEGGSVRVATVNLRDYLNEPIDLLKLDIEGAEYELVDHLRDAMTNVASLVLECHLEQSALVPFSKLLQDLEGAGFYLSLNTFGMWSDLVRRSRVAPFYSEQYLALYGRRPDAALPASPSSDLPYVDLALLRQLSRGLNRRGAPEYYEHDAVARQLHLGLETKIKLSRPFTRDGGLSWCAMLPDSVPIGDTNEHPRSSELVLLEDDRPIGPPHTQHELIQRYGGGRYSHWHRAVFFSTPDDSNPNLNKRRYVVGIPKAAGRPRNWLVQLWRQVSRQPR